MAAMVGGEAQCAAADTQRRVAGRRGRGERRCCTWPGSEHGGQQSGDEGAAAHHQSSFTERTMSRPAAAWPLPQAVSAPATTTPMARPSKVSGGTVMAIVQWKLCGLTTFTST